MASAICATVIAAGSRGDAAPATRAPEALHEPGLRERAQLLLQESERDLLTLGDLARRHQGVLVAPFGELDHGSHRVFELLGDLEHGPVLLRPPG